MTAGPESDRCGSEPGPAGDTGPFGLLVMCVLVVLVVGVPIVTTANTNAVGRDHSNSPPDLSLSVPAVSTAADSNVTATITLRNVGSDESVGPVVRIGDLPPGWRIVNQSSPNGTWRDSTREWLWMRLEPGESVTAAVTLSVPGNASGEYRIPVSADDADNVTASASLTVGVGTTPGNDTGTTVSDRNETTVRDDRNGTTVDGDGNETTPDEDPDPDDDGDGGGGGGSSAGPLLPAVLVVGVIALGAGAYLYRREDGSGE